MKYTWRNIVGNVLATAVLISSLGIPAAAAEPKTEKSETVYVITDAAGLPGDVIVSDWLKNLDGKDIPIVQDGCWGLYFGEMKVSFN